MPRTTATINKETLYYICSKIGVSTTYLANKSQIPEETIVKWLAMEDATLPTIVQAKRLAKALRIPFAGLYMSKDVIPLKQLPDMHNLRTIPAGVVIDDSAMNLAIIDLIRSHDFLISAESELGLEGTYLTLPTVSTNTTVTECAKLIRDFFEIRLDEQFKMSSSRQFYLYVRRKIESKGVFVHCFTGVDVEAVRGISMFNGSHPIIGINNDDRYPAKTFSIIHELVHILKRKSALCNDMYASFSLHSEEVTCNAIAGEVLVPAESIIAYLSANSLADINLENVESLAKRYSVSKEVIIRRLHDTGKFSKDVYDTFATEIRQSFLLEREEQKNARKEGRSEPVFKSPSMETVDKNSASICRIMLIGYSDGFYNKQDLSGLLGIKEKHIPKFIAEVEKW